MMESNLIKTTLSNNFLKLCRQACTVLNSYVDDCMCHYRRKETNEYALVLCRQYADNNSGSLCVALFHNDVLYSFKHSHVCCMKGLSNINYRVLLVVVLTAYLTFVSFHMPIRNQSILSR